MATQPWLASLLGMDPNQGLLTKLLGPAPASPIGTVLGGDLYNENEARAAGFSGAMHGFANAINNPNQYRSSGPILSEAIGGLGRGFKAGQQEYETGAIRAQQAKTTADEQKRKEQDDLWLADIVAQHPEWAGMGAAEMRKLYADLMAQKAGIQTGSSRGFGTEQYERIPNPDPKTKEQYPYVWRGYQESYGEGPGKTRMLAPGEQPPTDPGLLAEQAGKKRSAVEQSKINAQKPQITLNVDTAVQNSQQMEMLIGQLYNHPGLDQILGLQGMMNDVDAIRNLNSGPATDAYGIYNSIISNYVVNTLNQMRQASTHGGAFGNVTDFENKLLAAKANLERSRDAESFRRNLQELMVATLNARAGLVKFYNNLYPDSDYQPMENQPLPDSMKGKPGEGGGTPEHGGGGGDFDPATGKVIWK